MKNWQFGLLLIGLALLGFGLYTQRAFPLEPQTQTVTATETVTVANTTTTTTVTQIQTQTKTIAQYVPTSGIALNNFSITYVNANDSAYKEIFEGVAEAILSPSCEGPVAYIKTNLNETARGFVLFKKQCSFEPKDGEGIEVCIQGEGTERYTRYTRKNVFPAVAIGKGVLVIGDVGSKQIYKLPANETTAYIWLFRNKTKVDELKLSIDKCGVTAVNYGWRTHLIVPLQAIGLDLSYVLDTSSLLMGLGVSLVAIAAYFLYRRR